MATNREWALATAARLLPRRAAIRRWRAVKKGCRRERLAVQAASSKALRSQRLPPPMELFLRLPADSLLPGQMRAQEAKWAEVGNRVMSVPTSAMIC